MKLKDLMSIKLSGSMGVILSQINDTILTTFYVSNSCELDWSKIDDKYLEFCVVSIKESQEFLEIVVKD